MLLRIRKMFINTIFNFFRILIRQLKMSRKIFLLLFLILSTYKTFADRVGNGGELSEGLFIEVYSQIPKLIEACLSSSECADSSNVKLTLQSVNEAYLAESKYNLPNHQVQFLSAKKHPEIFGRSPTKQLWATKPTFGAKIYLH